MIAMTEKEFQQLQVPVFPYSDFGKHENPTSIGYFVKNTITRCQLNVWFCKLREEATITLFNPYETEMYQHEEIFRTKLIKKLGEALVQFVNIYLR